MFACFACNIILVSASSWLLFKFSTREAKLWLILKTFLPSTLKQKMLWKPLYCLYKRETVAIVLLEVMKQYSWTIIDRHLIVYQVLHFWLIHWGNRQKQHWYHWLFFPAASFLLDKSVANWPCFVVDFRFLNISHTIYYKYLFPM